ncbi:MAG: hypothetical protein JWO81_2442 [Alphaproteobacteria bacterium]|nr:hypothetical protein [Alphaproteobacteria bacterium]
MTTTTDTSAPTGTNATGAGGQSGGSDGGPLASVRQSAADAYEAARERTASAYSSARNTAASAGRRTADGIDGNPMAALVGGLALGAIVGALFPVTRQERQLLGNAGRRLNDTARQAVNAARDAGKERLDGFTDQALGAVRASASAAAGSVRGSEG